MFVTEHFKARRVRQADIKDDQREALRLQRVKDVVRDGRLVLNDEDAGAMMNAGHVVFSILRCA